MGWYWEAVEPGKCKLIYLMHGDPRGSMPTWVVNGAVTEFAKNFFIIRKILEANKS
jgi:hypothetical protein